MMFFVAIKSKADMSIPVTDWNLCDISKISNLSMTGTGFDNARPGYKKGDKDMRHIYAEL